MMPSSSSPPSTDAARLASNELLRDGRSIHVRAIRPDDKERLLDHFGRLGPVSIRYRFFGVKNDLTESELVFFTELDFVERVGLVATLHDGDRERIIGVGRYVARQDAAGDARAEVAFAVADAHQGRGIGTLLLERLAVIAEANGIKRLEAEVLGDNRQMIEVFKTSGLEVDGSIDSGVFHLTFVPAASDSLARAERARQEVAIAASLGPLLGPRSVGILDASGASEVAMRMARQLRSADVSAQVVVGDPTGETELEPLDLAVLPVARDADGADETLETCLRQCTRAGVRGLLLMAPIGDPDGRARLADRVRRRGMRLIGPNSAGLIDATRGLHLSDIDWPRGTPGSTGLLVHTSRTLPATFPLSSFVSLGDATDVRTDEVLTAWARDPRIDRVALVLDRIERPERFVEVASVLAATKPVVGLSDDHGCREIMSQAAISWVSTIEELEAACG